MMKFRKAILTAALIVGHCASANAADLLPLPVVEPVPIPEPIAAREFYLKSFIGLSNQGIDTLSNPIIDAGQFTIVDTNFDSAPFIGLGIGITHSDRFRFDVTGEYRGRSDFTGLDTYIDPGCGPGVCTNEYSAIKSEWLFLANGFWDIGTVRGITPYVGAGIGTAAVTIDSFKDVNLVTNGLAYSGANTEWNFAWALHAGVSYEVADNLNFDLGYRYTYMGDGKTGSVRTYDPSDPVQAGTKFEDIDSHDIMVGLRWNFGGDSCCYSPEAVPIAYNPPAQTYSPPTVYAPPTSYK